MGSLSIKLTIEAATGTALTTPRTLTNDEF